MSPSFGRERITWSCRDQVEFNASKTTAFFLYLLLSTQHVFIQAIHVLKISCLLVCWFFTAHLPSALCAASFKSTKDFDVRFSGLTLVWRLGSRVGQRIIYFSPYDRDKRRVARLISEFPLVLSLTVILSLKSCVVPRLSLLLRILFLGAWFSSLFPCSLSCVSSTWASSHPCRVRASKYCTHLPKPNFYPGLLSCFANQFKCCIHWKLINKLILATPYSLSRI